MRVGISALLVLVAATMLLMSGGIPSSAAPPQRALAAEPVEVLTGDNNYFLKINLRDSRVRPRVMLANNDSGGLQSLSGIKTRLENQGYASWAIVNGDLFSAACPGGVNCAQGLTYIDGQRKDNWSAYGNTWMVRGNLGLDNSNNVQIAVGDGQSRRYMTIGGGPRIVMGGGPPTCSGQLVTVGGVTKTYFPASGEYFDGDVTSWCSDPRAITLLGYSADGQYLYMGISYGGKTVTQLAQWLKDRGAYEVLRLDSGGSSGMYHNGSFVGGSNSRAIADAFALIVESGPSPTPTPPAPPPGEWQVEYFSDTNLSSRCAGPNNESGTFVFRDWQEGTPAGGCPSDNWSARFRRRVHFQSGSYTFGLGADDWGRIWVGGDLVVDKWQASNQHYESRSLSAGDYDVTVEFADTLGHAKIAAWWWGPGFNMPREQKDPQQWYAEYWGNKDLWWDSIVRVNEGTNLDHEWYGEGPGYSLPADRFSSRFERRVHFPCGRYRFNSYADDGVRFKISEVNGGNWLINEWHDGRATYPSDPVDLAEGDYTLILEHYENGGWARVSLSWEFLQGCHTVSTPSTPSGPSSGETGQALNYTTGGSTDSQGHGVQYRFDLGDGTYSTWSSSASVSHSWSSANTYCVKAQARCSVDNGVVSSWSGCKDVTISSPPPEPDLVPAQWGDWEYPIVPSSTTGTTVVNTLYACGPTYVDWGIANSGTADCGADAYGDLYIDGTRLAHYNFGNVLAGWSWAFFDWTETVYTPGWHTLKVVADPGNLVEESDETNNSWERQFYWEPDKCVCVEDWHVSCGESHSWNNGYFGSTDQIDSYSCWPYWEEAGPEYTYLFAPDVSTEATVLLDYDWWDYELDLFVIDDVEGSCSAGNCITYGDDLATFNAEAGHTYYLVVDGYSGDPDFGDVGDYTITVNCSSGPTLDKQIFLPLVVSGYTTGATGQGATAETPDGRTASPIPKPTAIRTPSATPSATATATPMLTPTVVTTSMMTPTPTAPGMPTVTPVSCHTPTPTEIPIPAATEALTPTSEQYPKPEVSENMGPG